MEAIFEFEFVQNAIIAGVLVSIASGIIGSLIVVNRMLFLAGGVAHSSYGGIGFAIYFNLPIFFGTSLFAISMAILIAILSLKNRERVDTFIGILWAFGVAIGVIFIDLSQGYRVDLMSYLFGSILAVSNVDLYFLYTLLPILIGFILFFYRDILAISYDMEYAKMQGINSSIFYISILTLSALTIVIAIKIVGLILVIALFSTPVYIAERLSNSLSKMMIISSTLSCFFTLTGLYISYSFNLTSGATIILVSTISLALFSLYRRLV